MSKKKNAGGPRGNGRAQLLVVPGEDLGDSDGMEAGHGVLPISGRLRAVKQGRVRNQGSTISVEPVHTRYIPRPSDLVIGYIEGCTNNIWFVELGAPFNAILPMSLGPGKVEFGGTRSIMDIGDAILCRVQEVEETHSSVVTMKGMGLRKIRSGVVEEIDPHLLGRLIGKGGESLRRLKEETECRIVVADNGRMWIDGELDGILAVRNRLSQISEGGDY
ncbi:MAG: RNA-binding protein [Euryarchaeota archaeon]|nr:RNA-binding protein [Euryarchaeota archaeon]MEC9458007.1 KH domain-containing protein [Candidatus Thermoplasmatota archaeon]|tara:strand:- start:181 stop:837 length:657 start_codon:yes stop_codon:yes gene_type:complete